VQSSNLKSRHPRLIHYSWLITYSEVLCSKDFKISLGFYFFLIFYSLVTLTTCHDRSARVLKIKALKGGYINRVSGCNPAQSSRSPRFLNVILFIGPITTNLTWLDFPNHGTFRETTPFATAPILLQLKNCISASEGRRDFGEVAKCSQRPHLY
jgi:hypothetical protein